MTKILIVDDNTLNLDILKDALKHDYKLAFAKNGKMALKVIEKSVPDVILLDVLMPIMNGYETYNALKSNNELKYIPIIFLTGLDDIDKNMVRNNTDDKIIHVKKPFDIEVVRGTILDVLNAKAVV